ncbi:hypothetical protein [Mycolicibacterium pyrenivorans]|uniref:hypothetical protein n=1 Tax=Mycolicibacterium pyrenivorans TaxID=187102 RepID=UPI0021F29DDF|nr:hypothetical protein [Mycolicibacterium pyrenivorans]MCV7150411.1 hypothetical protein [Mycolicibacterium pyrenivorans]
MAEKFDVSSRLAEGRPAVDNVAQYVWACRLLGYQHPDLTRNAVQVRDWYDSENGMDLRALADDCVALEAAARSTQEALAVQDRQSAVLSGAWLGEGAQASQDFLRRHGDASAAVSAAVRTAAEALRALQENLWRAVDGKVASVVAIEGRTDAHRADWLAAAQTVTTGAGDRAAAAELVDHSVKPFVDSSIRTEWLSSMHTAMASVADAYQRAAAEIAAERHPVFDVPGDLGPTWSPPPVPACEERIPPAVPAAAAGPAALGVPAAPAATTPSAWSEPSAPPAAPPPAPPAETVPQPPAIPQAPAVPQAPVPPAGGLGSGIPDIGSGFSGLGQQFADTLRGLLGGTAGATPPELDVPELGDDLADPESDDPESDEEEPTDDAEQVEEPVEDPAEEPIVAGEPAPDAPACEPQADEPPVEAVTAPAPTPAPPPAEPIPPAAPPPADPVAAGQTPCAIAADELPQIGDPPE